MDATPLARERRKLLHCVFMVISILVEAIHVFTVLFTVLVDVFLLTVQVTLMCFCILMILADKAVYRAAVRYYRKIL